MYVYRLGDDEATLMFQPTPEQAQYCMASVICDEEGNLYYTNDSGHLFKIAGNGPAQGGDGGSGGGSGDGPGDGETGGGSGNDGGQTGGISGGSGQSGSNPNAGASGCPSTGNTDSTTTPSDDAEAGSVPAGAKPVVKGTSDEKEGVSQREYTADSDSGEKGHGTESVAVSEGASNVEANAARGMSLPARIAAAAGVVGVTGLVASGLWMAFTRRHKEV